MRKGSLCFVLLLTVAVLHAQFKTFSQYNSENGLSNNYIRCITKDSDGFLWIGTHEGLNRYDGTEFENIFASEKNNIPANAINSLCFTGKNLLAIATNAGVSFYNKQTGAGYTVSFPADKNFAGYGSDPFFEIYFDTEKKKLFIAGQNGLFVTDSTGKLSDYILKPSVPLFNTARKNIRDAFASRIFKDRQGEIFFYSNFENRFFYPDFKHKTYIPVNVKDPSNKLNSYMEDNLLMTGATGTPDDYTIAFTNLFTPHEKLLSYIAYKEGSSGALTYLPVPDSTFNTQSYHCIYNAFHLNDSIFILNAYAGHPSLYNIHSKKIEFTQNNESWFTSWPDGMYSCYYKLSGSSFWTGNHQSLIKITLGNKIAQTNASLQSALDKTKGISYIIQGMFCDSIFYTITVGGGLFKTTSHNIITQPVNHLIRQRYPEKNVMTGLIKCGHSFLISSIYGSLWWHESSNTLSSMEGKNKDASIDSINTSPFIDSKGIIWMNLRKGICAFDTVAKQFTNYYRRAYGGVFPGGYCTAKTEDNDGNMWFSTGYHLVKFNRQNNTFDSVTLTVNGKPVYEILYAACGSGDEIYLCAGQTFIIYNVKKRSCRAFSRQTGIVSLAVNDMTADAYGNAWLATERGLVFYNKKEDRFESFTTTDGLPQNLINNISFADKQKKILFLGYATTYCLIPTDSLLRKTSLPANKIVSVFVNDSAITFDNKKIYSYAENNFTFKYTGLNYDDGRNNTYAIMLTGIDTAWRFMSAERSVSYFNLPPGNYVFRIKTANQQGIWNEDADVYSFEIKPPFWQTWWFRICAILLAIAGIYILIKNREASIKKDNDLKLQMSELKMQALQAQLNPHFIFNSLNSIQSYILANDPVNAAGYLARFSTLMRRILNQSKHSLIPLSEAVDTLKIYVELESFRFNNEFRYSFIISGDEDIMRTKIPPMLLQPFAENAILHGLMPKQGEKKLIIDIHEENDKVIIKIDDNGVGRNNEFKKTGHQSQGEKLTKGLIENIPGAEIIFTDKKETDKPAGTTVSIIIPLNT